MVRCLAGARIALGVGLVLAPGLAARTWFGSDERGLRLVLQSIGARDLALGAGLLAANGDAGRWLAAGVAADVVDAVASARAVGELPPARIAPGTLLAVAFATAGTWAALGQPS